MLEILDHVFETWLLRSYLWGDPGLCIKRFPQVFPPFFFVAQVLSWVRLVMYSYLSQLMNLGKFFFMIKYWARYL